MCLEQQRLSLGALGAAPAKLSNLPAKAHWPVTVLPARPGAAPARKGSVSNLRYGGQVEVTRALRATSARDRPEHFRPMRVLRQLARVACRAMVGQIQKAGTRNRSGEARKHSAPRRSLPSLRFPFGPTIRCRRDGPDGPRPELKRYALRRSFAHVI